MTIHVDIRAVRFIMKIYAFTNMLHLKFWNSKFHRPKKQNLWLRYLKNTPFYYNLEYLYNQLITPISHYYRKNDLKKLFENSSIKEYKIYSLIQG